MVTATFGSVGKNDTKAPHLFYKENQGKIKKIKSFRHNLKYLYFLLFFFSFTTVFLSFFHNHASEIPFF